VGNQNPRSINDGVHQLRDQISTPNDIGRYQQKYQGPEFQQQNTRQQNMEQTPIPKFGECHQVRNQNSELSSNEMQTEEQRTLQRKGKMQQVSYQTTTSRNDERRDTIKELGPRPRGDEA
jgi:hypothetical protein